MFMQRSLTVTQYARVGQSTLLTLSRNRGIKGFLWVDCRASDRYLRMHSVVCSTARDGSEPRLAKWSLIYTRTATDHARLRGWASLARAFAVRTRNIQAQNKFRVLYSLTGRACAIMCSNMEYTLSILLAWHDSFFPCQYESFVWCPVDEACIGVIKFSFIRICG